MAARIGTHLDLGGENGVPGPELLKIWGSWLTLDGSPAPGWPFERRIQIDWLREVE